MRSATAAAYIQRFALGAALILASAGTAKAATSLYIRGAGNGHGIGMSQYGAYGYALHGRDYPWILAHYFKGTALGIASPGATVRVLLPGRGATFSGATSAGNDQLKSDQAYSVQANADGSVTLRDQQGKKVASFSSPVTASGPGPLTLAGMGTYRGALEFRASGVGGVETVNVVGLEDYVRGVIAAEMPSGWSSEALKAQAVAARTYALTSDVGGSVFDVYSDTRSQVYGGVGAETPATDAAVTATRGGIVTYRGAPAATYFFSSSGGHTENVENVWPGGAAAPWLRGVVDRYDGAAHDPYHRWGYRLTGAAAARKLAPWLKGALVGVRVTKHGVSPRIITAQVVGTAGRTTVTGNQIQASFGLLSTWASFTTIQTSSASGRVVRSRAVGNRTPLMATLAKAPPGIAGLVFPAPRGARITIQSRTGRRWRTVARIRLRAGGRYAKSLSRSGTYRIVYRGLTGPAVTVG